MLTQILSLMNFILGRADRWRDKNQEQRARVAAYLNSVSDCLARVAAELRAGQESHGGCAELAHYAAAIPDSVKQELEGEAASLARELERAVFSRLAVKDRKIDASIARDNLKAIEETAGKIKALAVSLAAG